MSGVLNLVDGKTVPLKHGFMPSGRIAVYSGYVCKAFVCLDCGFLGHYLTDLDVQDIRDKRDKGDS
jgi:hypothetical protein